MNAIIVFAFSTLDYLVVFAYIIWGGYNTTQTNWLLFLYSNQLIILMILENKK